MPAAARVRPLDLFTAQEWEQVRHRSTLMGLGLILHVWGVIALAMALSIWSIWFLPISVLIIGGRQLGLAIIMHDAAHGCLSTAGRLNDFLGQWLGAAPIGVNLRDYRNYHLQHHKYVQQPEDPDLGLSAPFPITRASLRRKIIRDLTGQTFYKQRLNQFQNALGLGIRPGPMADLRKQGARRAVVPFLITNAILFSVLAVLGHWWAYFALWLLPMATWNMLVIRIRNIGEHAVVPSNDDPMRHARTTRASFIERLLIAPYWVNYHCEHHMFMHVPCYRLGRAHRILERKGLTEKMEISSGYLDVLRQATSQPAAEAA
ncbi:MAG: fatty acid desaturase family protein [Pseudomonadota bacterium]